MGAKTPSEMGRTLPKPVVQQSMLQQAQATADGQADPASPTRREALLEMVDLITTDSAEDGMAPPAYGQIHDDFRNEKSSVGISTNVSEDGRINIHINQFNRRLSQIFTPTLRHELEGDLGGQPPPSPHIPPSLVGDEGFPPPPPLNIVIQVVGSRGDVQPFVALAKVLKDTHGHRVRLATHPNFKDFVQENGLEFFSIGADPSQLMAFMVKNPSLMPSFHSTLSGDISQRRKIVAEYIQGCWRSCYEAGDGMGPRSSDDDLSEPTERPFVADCIIANPPSFAHIHCAEKLGIPLHIMFTMPYSPTQAFPHPLANVQSSNADPQITNYLSYVMIEFITWQGLGDIINRFRAKCLGLDPVSVIWGPGMLQRLKIPHTYCWSPALIPKPKDWGRHISIAGFYFLGLASNYIPAPDFQAFLDAGPPPVYVGFGSIVLEDADAMTKLIFEVVRKTGQRVLLSKGWGGLGVDKLGVPEGVFMLGNVPHDWLFRHVSCVVHHGGAGTTAAGIAAGRPTVVVPFFGDQLFWGAMIARAGAGPNPIPHKQLTAERLANAIEFCLKPESLERANELAGKIAAERGSDMGAQSFHQNLDLDKLRCTLAPSRSAVWRVKRTQVKLSAFAASTLANANLLDFHDLKLFRPQEYQTDEGPWDPVSGGAAACYRSFSSMVMGVGEVPSETWKAIRIPFDSNRQHSRKSRTVIVRKAETSQVAESSSSLILPEQSQASLNPNGSLTRAQSPPSLSGLSSPVSNVEPSPVSDASQDQMRPKQGDPSLNRARSRNEVRSGKDRDMLRRTGAHTSKGLGRSLKAFVQTPMDVTVGLTKGFHNFPKLWGDDTVRPQEQVSDFKSGATAAGKEFGYGWYDGVTGLVTQPWRGAQKEGATGFVKGIGKGVAGFATKPTAGFAGLLGHTLKGVHKEVQKTLGSNMQTYIVASRVAQGYEEWRQSSDAEKQDIIDRWKLTKKDLKKKSDSDLQYVLKTQRMRNMEDTVTCQNSMYTTDSVSTDAPIVLSESDILARGVSQSSEESLEAAEINEVSRPSIQEASRKDMKEDANVEGAVQESVSRLQRRQLEAADHPTGKEGLHQVIAANETEAQRHATEELKFQKQLEQAMAQSLSEQRPSGSDRERESDIGFQPGGSSNVQRPYSYDPGHLTGTRQSEFGAQQQGHRSEKSAEERNEEEIVMEYIKKQSLLEVYHQNKSKARATSTEDNDEERAELE